MLDEALILAGGLGTRLGDLTRETPKPILPVGGVPFLDYVLWNLSRHGIQRAAIATGHLADKVEQTLGHERHGVRLQYAAEPEPLGTGGAVKFGSKHLGERFLVLNGDTILDANLTLLGELARPSSKAAIALRHVDDVSRFGEVREEAGVVTAFGEKSGAGPGFINGGIYALHKSMLAALPDGPCSLERDLLPHLAAQKALLAVKANGFFIDIGLPETLANAETELPAWRDKPMVLLDRDGVINVNYGHVHTPEQFAFTEDAPRAVRWLNEHGYLVVVVTNQAGIAKGYYTEHEYLAFAAYIGRRLAEHGAHIDEVLYCPNHPTEGQGRYRISCGRRKPEPGMILEALEHWSVVPSRAVLIGDTDSDAEAARRAGVRSVRYESGSLMTAVEHAISLVPRPYVA